MIRSRATDEQRQLGEPVGRTDPHGDAPTAPDAVFFGSAKPQVINTADTDPIELGVQFQSSTAGTISGIRFYKGSQDMGTHTGTLWSSTARSGDHDLHRRDHRRLADRHLLDPGDDQSRARPIRRPTIPTAGHYSSTSLLHHAGHQRVADGLDQ